MFLRIFEYFNTNATELAVTYYLHKLKLSRGLLLVYTTNACVYQFL